MHSDPFRLLVFDLSGEYGHFRKINTNSSPLTYGLPTRVALAGLLGAVMGIERETGPGKYAPGITPAQEFFAKEVCGIGVQLLRPVSKTVMGFNLLMTSKSFFEIENRTQIPFELLKNPAFRVFFYHQDAAVFDQVCERIAQRNHHFTPYLGLSQFTCSLDFQGVVEAIQRYGSNCPPIHSAVNLNDLPANPLMFEEGRYYLSETMPIAMTRDRIVTEYGEVLFEGDAQTLAVRSEQWTEAGSFGNILFL